MEQTYPLGTIVYYGPDKVVTTKIVASVIIDRDAVPIQKNWRGDNITTDPAVIHEIGIFLKSHGVKKVVMPDHNVGCEHVEGIDYPEGEACPYCPYWSQVS